MAISIFRGIPISLVVSIWSSTFKFISILFVPCGGIYNIRRNKEYTEKLASKSCAGTIPKKLFENWMAKPYYLCYLLINYRNLKLSMIHEFKLKIEFVVIILKGCLDWKTRLLINTFISFLQEFLRKYDWNWKLLSKGF